MIAGDDDDPDPSRATAGDCVGGLRPGRVKQRRQAHLVLGVLAAKRRLDVAEVTAPARRNRQGHSALSRRDVRTYRLATAGGLVGSGRQPEADAWAAPGRAWEVVSMMFWYGGPWAVRHSGLMWGGSVAFWAQLVWGAYIVNTGRTRQ